MDKQTPTSREVVMTAIEATRGGLGDEFIASFSDDLEFWFPGSTPISGRRRGLAEFQECLIPGMRRPAMIYLCICCHHLLSGRDRQPGSIRI